MPTIHPTATVDPKATLADDVVVGPYCFIGPGVTIGQGTRLIAHVTVLGPTTIGCHNTIYPQAVLGGDPQDLSYRGEPTTLSVGDHNEIRECVTLHRGTLKDGGQTVLGDHNLIMAYCHLGHDCIVGSHIIMANSVQVAGHVHIEDHANISGSVGIHHFCTIGGFAYIGGMTRIVHDVPPYMVVEGNPSRVRKVNTTLLKRHGFDEETQERLKKAFRLLYARNGDGTFGSGTTVDILAFLETMYPQDAAIERLVQSIQRSTDGLHGRYREALRQPPATQPADV